jgi:hypothetical protein
VNDFGLTYYTSPPLTSSREPFAIFPGNLNAMRGCHAECDPDHRGNADELIACELDLERSRFSGDFFAVSA